MKTVDSTNVHSIGYDKNEQLIIIELHDGTFYKFEKVPESVNIELFEDVFREDIFVKKVKYEYDFEELKVLINVWKTELFLFTQNYLFAIITCYHILN